MPPKRGVAASLADLGPAQAAQLCSAIEATNALPPAQILELLKANAPPCAPIACKSNRKDHPGCFCCLAPAHGSSRKKGLWQREAGLLGALGPDPEERKRQVRPGPGGMGSATGGVPHGVGLHGGGCHAMRGTRPRALQGRYCVHGAGGGAPGANLLGVCGVGRRISVIQQQP